MPKFSRTNKQREAFQKSLAKSLILHGKITTTKTRAKATQQYVEKLITKAKTNDLATTRLLASRLDKICASKLVKEISPKLADRKGGYTRVINLPPRKSDASQMAILEILN